jgi:hypothetical protein
MKIGTAFRAFFAALFDNKKATAIEHALDGVAPAKITIEAPSDQSKRTPAQTPQPTIAKTARSDALTLLAVLQREARFIDLVQEPLANYSDAQVGAAARDVIQQTHKVLQRMFDIHPLSAVAEGTLIDLPKDVSSSRWKPIGEAAQKNRVTIVHPGWIATASSIPVWTGTKEDAGILMPTEIE